MEFAKLINVSDSAWFLRLTKHSLVFTRPSVLFPTKLVHAKLISDQNIKIVCCTKCVQYVYPGAAIQSKFVTLIWSWSEWKGKELRRSYQLSKRASLFSRVLFYLGKHTLLILMERAVARMTLVIWIKLHGIPGGRWEDRIFYVNLVSIIQIIQTQTASQLASNVVRSHLFCTVRILCWNIPDIKYGLVNYLSPPKM